MDGNSSQKVVVAPPSNSNDDTSSSQEPLNNIQDIVETSDKEISTISLIKPEYDNVSGNYLVSSIHTNELGSDNSSVIHVDDLDVDTFFLSQSSQLSEDSGSIVSYPNSDVMNSLVATPEISYQDEHERKVPIMPAPVEYTPIITKVDENETDPPPIFITNNETQLFQCTTWFSKY
ncbi:5977_t:CDS:2 [Entrophospora sp. SA101]|nr:5977_t:CDS:2 [Entrophospora sp. SA101]